MSVFRARCSDAASLILILTGGLTTTRSASGGSCKKPAPDLEAMRNATPTTTTKTTPVMMAANAAAFIGVDGDVKSASKMDALPVLDEGTQVIGHFRSEATGHEKEKEEEEEEEEEEVQVSPT